MHNSVVDLVEQLMGKLVNEPSLTLDDVGVTFADGAAMVECRLSNGDVLNYRDAWPYPAEPAMADAVIQVYRNAALKTLQGFRKSLASLEPEAVMH